MIGRPPSSTLFPYPSLFRSVSARHYAAIDRQDGTSDPCTLVGCEEEDCAGDIRSEEHTSELQSPDHLGCRLLLEKKNQSAGPGRPLALVRSAYSVVARRLGV